MAGFCRYSSPVQSWRTQKPGGFGVVNLPWPMVGKDDWCGDFEPAVQAIPKIDIKGG